MPLSTDLPTGRVDGDPGHTAGHNATNTRVNAIATEVNAHEGATTSVHGIADTSVLATASSVTSAISTHSAASDPHGDRAAATSAIATHAATTTSVHGIANTAALATTAAVAAGYQPLAADLTGLAGLGNGNPVRTGGTWSVRSDAALASALGVSGGGASNDPGPLEGMPVYAYGHSYSASSPSYNTGTGGAGNWVMRLADRKRMTLTNRATSGRRMIDTSGCAVRDVLSGSNVWTVNTRGLVTLCCTVNDVVAAGTDAATLRSYGHAVRTILAATRAKAKVSAATAAWVYSANWTSSSTSAITSTNRFQTTTAGSYAEVNVTGAACDLLLTLRASANGVYTVTSNGSTVATVSSMNTTMGVDYTPAIISLSGLGSGTHTIRITLTSGSWLGVDAVFIPSETPPPVLVVGEGDVIGASFASLAGTWLPILSSVTAEFSNAVYLTPSGWDTATMLREDGVHPNDYGASVLATQALDALDVLAWSNGLNLLTTQPSYTPPSAPSVPSGGQDGTGAGAGPTVADDFTGSNGALAGRSTPTGSKTWAVATAGWAIASNALAWTGSADSAAVLNSGLSDNYEIQFTCTAVTGQYPFGIAVRGSSTTTYFTIYRDQTANTWTLVDLLNGTPVGSPSSQSSATDVANGGVIKCRVQGTTITLLLNGTQVGQWTGISYQSGQTFQGIRASASLGATFDDFSITAI